MKPFYRGNQFAGAPTAGANNPGLRPGHGERGPGITSGPNTTGSGSVRCEMGGNRVASAFPPAATPGVVMDERLAHISDEGSNSVNGAALNEHISGQFEGKTILGLVDAVRRAEEKSRKDGE